MGQFRKISSEELFPTEQLGPEIEGTVLFPTPNGMSELQGAYIATSERLFMNVDMGERVYERVVGIHEINGVASEEDTLTITFDIGPIKMVNLNIEDLRVFTDFLQSYIK